ncbi:MAG: methyltransferase [Arenimonas sp.]|nr:methyltransferase [Arenimonas sp.]
MKKVYDRDYFDNWYRRRDLGGPAALARKVALAVATTEYHLGRPIRSVLDVGCGEGAWRSPLLKLRPGLNYMGLDSSDYAIDRYGASRNLHWMPFGDLAAVGFSRPVDLLVCSDVMHYLSDEELQRGLKEFARLCHGVAFLEVFAEGDDIIGDLRELHRRPATWYRRAFGKAGFTAIGSHLYLSEALAERATALELPR